MSNIINIGGGAGGSSGGGHTILDNSGTSLTQRSEMQFKGAYSEDNSTDQITEVNVMRSMTKAQFDLLSESEKQGLINVTDVTGGGENEFQPIIYSETEREIGVWTDGKPLYENTFDFGSDTTISRNSWTSTSITVTGVELIVFCSGLGSDGSYQSSLLAWNDSGTLKLQTPRNTDGSVRYVTIRYTKTTDTAGSGTWTPQGVPAVHYSTTEQVVGTWVDGSTLYEKTYTGLSVDMRNANTWYDTGLLSSGIDTFVAGEMIDSNNQSYPVNVAFMSSNTKIGISCGMANRTGVILTIRYTKASS